MQSVSRPEPQVAQTVQNAESKLSPMGMTFDTETQSLASLKKFQEPARFGKAQFQLKLYRKNA